MIFLEMAFEVNKYFMAQYTTHIHTYKMSKCKQKYIYKTVKSFWFI